MSKILFIDHGMKPIGGGQINSLNIIKGLLNHKHEIFIISFSQNDFTRQAQELNIFVKILQNKKFIFDLSLRNFFKNPIKVVEALFFSIKVSLKIKQLIREHQIEIIWPCDNLSRVITSFISLSEKAKVICPIMEEFPDTFVARFLRWIYLSNFDLIIPVSKKVASFFETRNTFNTSIKVIHTGIDLEKFNAHALAGDLRYELGIPDKDIIVGCIGRICNEKGQDLLLKAFSKASVKSPNLFLIFIGDGPNLKSLKNEVNNSHFQNREKILFTGFKSDVERYINLIDICVVPSRTEASSMVILEAGALMKPVIAFNIGGISEMMMHDKTGFLVDPENINQMASAINRLEDPNQRITMGLNAREFIHANFRDEIINKQINDLISSLI